MTGIQTLVSPPGEGFFNPTGIVAGADGTLYVTNATIRIGHALVPGGVWALDPTNQTQALIYQGPNGILPGGIAASSSGTLFTTEQDNTNLTADLLQITLCQHAGQPHQRQ